jgi:hypothetical protein
VTTLNEQDNGHSEDPSGFSSAVFVADSCGLDSFDSTQSAPIDPSMPVFFSGCRAACRVKNDIVLVVDVGIIRGMYCTIFMLC